MLILLIDKGWSCHQGVVTNMVTKEAMELIDTQQSFRTEVITPPIREGEVEIFSMLNRKINPWWILVSKISFMRNLLTING
jgi:hypothetical protein